MSLVSLLSGTEGHVRDTNFPCATRSRPIPITKKSVLEGLTPKPKRSRPSFTWTELLAKFTEIETGPLANPVKITLDHPRYAARLWKTVESLMKHGAVEKVFKSQTNLDEETGEEIKVGAFYFQKVKAVKKQAA